MTFSKLRNILLSYKTVLKNTIYLSLLEVVHILLPFIALPYIIKTVGAENYGKIALAQVVAGYFLIFVNFGLDILAVRFVSRNRESKNRLRLIVGAVLSLKGLTFTAGLAVFSVIVVFWPKANIDWPLFYASYLICLADVFFMPWFFQGIEKMFVITIVRGSSMLLYIASLLFLLHEKNQYWLVPLLQSSALLLTSIYGFYYMCRKEKVFPLLPSLRFMKKLFKESFTFFLSRSSVILNNSLATLVIGVTMTPYNVAVYDIARRIASAALIPVSMLIQAIYPHNALKRDQKFAMRAFAGLLGVGFAGVAALYFLAPYLVAFLGHGQLPEAVPLLRFLEIHIVLCIFTYYLGTPLLVAWGYSKPFNDSVLVSSASILLIYGIFFACNISSIYWYAAAIIIAESIILLYRSFYCFKHKIMSFSQYNLCR